MCNAQEGRTQGLGRSQNRARLTVVGRVRRGKFGGKEGSIRVIGDKKKVA